MHQIMMMHDLCILLLFYFSYRIVADQYTNNCPIRSSDYSVIDNADYQPTNPLLMLRQLTVMSKEACAFECLTDIFCLTATFKIDTGQCIFYFEQMIDSQLLSFSGGFVLSVNGNNCGLSNLIRLLSPSDSIFSIWNSGVGLASSPSSDGFGYGQYSVNQTASNTIDQNLSTKYLNYGNSSKLVLNAIAGIGSGFYVTTSLAVPSILSRFRIGTGNDHPDRDPLVISIEGSNGGNLTEGTSWTVIYNGSTGLETDPGRQTFGPFQSVPNVQLFSSYRLLTVTKRSIEDSVQYSEVEFYGHSINMN